MFIDREDAGEKLAEALGRYRAAHGGLVLALPRGGVVVGFALSRRLGLPLDVFISQKIRAAEEPELALGAVTERGTMLADRAIEPPLAHMAKQEVEWRRLLYRGGRPLPLIAGRIVILVDDGAATGSTFLAAAQAVDALAPKRLVAALPVASVEASDKIRGYVDELVALERPEDLVCLGDYYDEFRPVSDAEVLKRLSYRQGRDGVRRDAFAPPALRGRHERFLNVD
ncbi:MAG: phosphoribosyltransferase [Elusimicrobia bacterium]|nr:phosphoribosyltransferase [Elusimicrobiota bacterium]